MTKRVGATTGKPAEAKARKATEAQPEPAIGRAAKPAAIVAAAERLFLAQGYGATSMDAVAREAPVSKRTLYNHFDSKERLFAAVVAEAWAGLTQAPASADADADPHDALKAYVARLREHWAHPDVLPLLRLIIGEAAQSPELADSYLAAGKGPAVNELARIFARIDDPLGLPAKARSVQFLGMIKEALFWPLVFGVPAAGDADAVIEAAIRRVAGSTGGAS